MKRTIILLVVAVLSAVIAPYCLAEPVAKKKVAVYMTESNVDDAYNKVISSKMVAKITQSPEYMAVERTADFLKALQSEKDFGTSGEVRDGQIARIGQMLGVKFVAVVDVSEVMDEIYVAARLINVESGAIIATSEEYSHAENMAQLVALAEKVASNLTGQASSSSFGNSSSSSGFNGGNVETFTVNGVSFDMVKVTEAHL
ncbi:MAG: hypothetical protein K2K97_04965 [Muribaculaceae bacterium]|nr:hypothetical protein [Muribaculaceae bacterium]